MPNPGRISIQITYPKPTYARGLIFAIQPSLVRAISGRFLNSSTIVIMRRKLFKLTLIQAFSTIVACSALLQAYASEVSTTSAASKPGFVSVSGTHFLRDGTVWVPHGINVVAFNAAPAVRTGLFEPLTKTSIQQRSQP